MKQQLYHTQYMFDLDMDHLANIKTSTFMHIIFPTVKIYWNYSTTSHRKGAVNEVGGTIKRLATRAINTRKDIVKDVNSLMNAAGDKTKTILHVINESSMKRTLTDMEIR